MYVGVKDNARRKRRCSEYSGCKANNCQTCIYCRDMKLMVARKAEIRSIMIHASVGSRYMPCYLYAIGDMHI